MTATVIIPARFASTRFPAKIVASDTGRPLVQHVVDAVRRCRLVRQVIVAADDMRIVEALRPFDTHCVMTSPHHSSGTDRIAEVARTLDSDIIVNVQGDEPEIEPEIVDGLIAHLRNSSDDMATAATLFPAGAKVADPNLVKVVMAQDGRAIYFSRSVIPYDRDSQGARAYYLHLGIYAYRRDFLLKFAALAPTPLETSEKLEQLRALEHGHSIYVMKVDRAVHGIDTPEQYEAFVKRWKGIG
ncbi:MAG TPA: 3-deoxy-manno-octulosonate cytidylyltransferase [Tepidisphaeraceae bacterium]|nr:3-deoxy-manno-octulosonate cytidylyltransferase [Tepidisphaeraceae bacterium]